MGFGVTFWQELLARSWTTNSLRDGVFVLPGVGPLCKRRAGFLDDRRSFFSCSAFLDFWYLPRALSRFVFREVVYAPGLIGFFLEPRTRWFVRRCLLVARSVPRKRCTLLVLVRRRVRYGVRRLRRLGRGFQGLVLAERGKFFWPLRGCDGNVSLLASSPIGVRAHRPVHRSEVYFAALFCS